MDNLRGAGLMVLAMLIFAVEDMVIKILAERLPTWQIILVLALGGAASIGAVLRAQGKAALPRAALCLPVLIRNTGEVIGTLGFVTALALTPISSASAILQATPLVVTLGAALILGEQVGWRRWAAICTGFLGVLLVIRPGLDGFDANALFAVVGVLGLATRDLATRRVPPAISGAQLSFQAFLVLVPAALILALASGRPWVAPIAGDWALLSIMVPLGVGAYFAIVAAMRTGEVSFVTPFRYSRILFALVIGMTVFAERPDALMLIGAALIVGSGLFTLWRERKLRPAA